MTQNFDIEAFLEEMDRLIAEEKAIDEEFARNKDNDIGNNDMNSMDYEPTPEELEKIENWEHDEMMLTVDGLIEICDVESCENGANFTMKPQLVTPKFCKHQRMVDNNQKCVCLGFKRLKNGKFVVEEDLLTDMKIINQEFELLATADLGSWVSRKYRNHRATIFALTTSDNKIDYDRKMDNLLHEMYTLRSNYGVFKDFGKKNSFSVFKPESVFNFRGMIEKIVEMAKNGVSNVTNFVNSIFEKLKGLISTFTEVVSSVLARIIEYVLNKCVEVVKMAITTELAEIFDKMVDDHRVRILIGVFCMLLLLAALELVGIFNKVLVQPLISALTAFFQPKAKYVDFMGEAPNGMISAIVALIGLILSMKNGDLSIISKRAMELNRLIQFGVASSALLGSLFICLPQVIQDSLRLTFLGDKYRDKMRIEAWMVKTHAIISLSKIPKILAHDAYLEWLNEQYKEAMEIQTKPMDKTVCLTFTKAFSDLTRVLGMVQSFRSNDKSRKLPYSIAISGEPGIGKSLMSETIGKILGVKRMYNRPMGDENYSGLTDHDGLMFDEFLTTDVDTKIRQCREYLQAVNTSVWKPPLASVDNLSIGIKGTEFAPTVVMTLSNFDYPAAPSGFVGDAINRRRRWVIRAVPNPDTPKFFQNNKVLMHLLTEEDILEATWLRFQIKPPVEGPEFSGAKRKVFNLYNLKELTVFLQKDKAVHDEICERLASTINVGDNAEFDPQAMLNNLMRDMSGIPNEPLSFFDSIKEVIFGGFKAEGPGVFNPVADKYNELLTQGMDEKEVKSSSDKSKAGKRAFNRLKDYIALIQTEVPMAANQRRLEAAQRKFLNSKQLMTKQQQKVIEDLLQRASEFLDDDDFKSCNGGDERFPHNGDVLAEINHENVDQTRIHRHVCSRCGKTFAHKHAERIHNIECGRCYDNEHMHAHKYGNEWEDNRQHVFSLTLDPNLMTLSEDEIQQLNKKLEEDFNYVDPRRAVASHLWVDVTPNPRSMFHEFGSGFPSNPSYNFYYDDGPSVRMATFELIARLVILFVCLYRLHQLLTKKKTDGDVYFGESSKRPERYHEGKTRQRPVFRRYGEGPCKGVILSIDGIATHGIPIGGRRLVTYGHQHFDKDLPSDTIMEVTYGAKTAQVRVGSCLIYHSREVDAVMIQLPSKIQLDLFPDQFKRFIKENDLKNVVNVEATFETPREDFHVKLCRGSNVSYGHDSKQWTLEDYFSYRVKSQEGDCGLPIISTGSWCPNKIVGMHIAGGYARDSTTKMGMATIITQEMITAAFEEPECDLGEVSWKTEGSLYANLIDSTDVPFTEVVHMPRNNKIKKSCLSRFLPTPPAKQPSLMSALDPRSDGRDPLFVALENVLNVEQAEVDQDKLNQVAEDLYENLAQNMFGVNQMWKPLTIEQAIGGVPGRLASLNIRTSSGYPLCKVSNKGKFDFFHWEKGELVIQNVFRQRCEELYNTIMDGGKVDSRFIAYLKDELTTQKKIDANTCRIIFSGDVTITVVGRMLYGNFIINYHESRLVTSSAIGLNQYSWDMQDIYNYLSYNGDQRFYKFIAGDFKNFDQNMNKQFQMKAYELIGRLSGVPVKAHEAFVKTQTDSPIQVQNRKYYLRTSHFSGCFFTTIINILVHEMYIRYVYQTLVDDVPFEQGLRLKILGDDHIYAVSDLVCDRINPVTISEALAGLGQTYTSDDKEAELTPEFREFHEITFLGAHPKIVMGKWCGALKKLTLDETLHWTRNNDLTVMEEAMNVMELSSVWGPAYYHDKIARVNAALVAAGYVEIAMPNHEDMIEIVASRTAVSGEDFSNLAGVTFMAEGPTVDPALTKINARFEEHQETEYLSNGFRKLTDKSTTVPEATLNLASDSFIQRDTFTWNESDPIGKAIWSSEVPFGMLDKGNQDNIQNYAFRMFEYVNTDIELAFQINGQPMTQGLAYIYFMPLASYEAELANVTVNDGVMFTPGESATVKLRVNYLGLRNLFSTTFRNEFFGTIYFTPLAKLTDGTGSASAQITVSARFPNAQFHIPSDKISPTISGGSQFYEIEYHRADGKKTTSKVWIDKRSTKSLSGIKYLVNWKPEGAGMSTTNNISYYNAGGTMPIQDAPINLGTSGKLAAELKADVSAIPLDNPPLASGAIPVAQAYPGMSSTYGVAPTVDLQLYPTAFQRQARQLVDMSCTNLATMLGRKCLLARYTVRKTDTSGSSKLTLPLNSTFGTMEGDGIPLNVGILNQFFYWKCDVIFEVVSVKTRFHSTRQSGVVNYGSAAINPESRGAAYNHIMDFSGENSVYKLRIEWNAQLEYLRTFEGYDLIDPFQNHSMGTLGFFLNNRLEGPETVATEVDHLIFIHFEQAAVAVPRGISPFTFNDVNRLSVATTPTTLRPMTGDTITGWNFPYTNAINSFFESVIAIRRTAFQPIDGTNGIRYGGIGEMTFEINTVSGVNLATHVYQSLEIEVYADEVNFYLPEAVSFNTLYSPTGSVLRMVSVVLSPLTKVQRNKATNLSKEVESSKSKNVVRKVTYPPRQTGVPAQPIRNAQTESGVVPEQEEIENVLVGSEDHVTTNGQIDAPPSVPCKLWVGHKFEKTVADILEIERRHRRISPVNNTSTHQFVRTTTLSNSIVDEGAQFLQMGVQLYSVWKQLFSVWFGSIKYRVFTENPGADVFFQPYTNDVLKVGLIPIDMINGSRFVSNTDEVTLTGAFMGALARERTYNTGSGSWIDVSAPFQVQKNFCLTLPTDESGETNSGTIAFQIGDKRPIFYQAAGDDYGYGYFRAPMKTNYDLTAFKNGIAGFHTPS